VDSKAECDQLNLHAAHVAR